MLTIKPVPNNITNISVDIANCFKYGSICFEVAEFFTPKKFFTNNGNENKKRN